MATIEKTQSHEQELARLQNEVEALREQLRRAQRLATVGTMTAMVAHEFNNILTPIINYARLARTNPDLTGKAIERAADGGQRATDICKAIMGFAGAGPDANAPCPVNVATLITDTLSAMARDPSRDGIEMVLDAPADLTLTTRPVELQQVLMNLLINARTAVIAKGGLKKIEILARRDLKHVVIEVRDSGVGIAPENLDKIFQPFFTTRGNDAESKGHGLGLTICQDIVTALGGSISVRSTLNLGTTFTLRLPA